MTWDRLLPLLIEATWQTLWMVCTSTTLAVLLGIPVGVLLSLTRPGGLHPHPFLHQGVGWLANVGRSLPFIILLILVAPLTKVVTGTSIGATAAIVPLTIGAIPFFARLVETSCNEVPVGRIDAGVVMGASTTQLVGKVLLPESLPSLVSGITVTFVALIGYSAMAGAIGGGGLGDVAIRYGYQRFDTRVTVATVVVLVAITQIVQFLGDRLSRRLSHR